MNERWTFYRNILIVLLLGSILYAPTIDYPGFLKTSTHDGYMATGDHGRDLYAFERTALGERPYRDYWWVYGPLMPYYYGAFMKLLGANMHAVHIGKLILHLVSGVLFLLILSRLIKPLLALCGAFWFLFFNQNFYHTYNDVGGIVLMLAVLLLLFHFMDSHQRAYFIGAQVLLVLLGLIKINIGASVMLAYYGSLLIVGKKKRDLKRCALSGAGVILAAVLIYGFFLKGLDAALIRQYFPLFNAQHITLGPVTDHLRMFFGLYWEYFTFSATSIVLALIVLAAFWGTLLRLGDKKEEGGGRQRLINTLIVLTVFYVCLLHEYLLTGIFYRIFWSVPLTILLMFTFLHGAVPEANKRLSTALVVALLGVLAVQAMHRLENRELVRTPGHFLSHPKAMVYVNNDPAWITTVSEATRFLETSLQPQETFLALPYDPIYYFLTSRKSPTAQLIFVKTAGPDDAGQARIIQALEEKNINWIVLSNAAHHEEESIGTFGLTHSRLLNEYIQRHFHVVQEFGDFSQPGAWASRHAVRILKRNVGP